MGFLRAPTMWARRVPGPRMRAPESCKFLQRLHLVPMDGVCHARTSCGKRFQLVNRKRLRFPTGSSYERSAIDFFKPSRACSGVATAGMYTHLEGGPSRISRGDSSCPNPKDAKSRRKLRPHHHNRVQRHRRPHRHLRHHCHHCHHCQHPLHHPLQSNRERSAFKPFFR